MLNLTNKDSISNDGYLANRNINKGTNIINELPIAYIPLKKHYSFKNNTNNTINSVCSHCLEIKQCSIKNCDICDLTYCSYDCQNYNIKFHKLFCQNVLLKNASSEIKLTYVLYLNKNKCPNTLYYENDNHLCNKLVKKESRNIQIIANYIYSEYINKEKKLKEIIKKLTLFLKYVFFNSFVLNLPIFDFPYALVIYNKISKFNHSCSPNCCYYFIKGKIFVFSTEKIEKNTECTISYISNLDMQDQSTRRSFILNKFGFLCKCLRCSCNSTFCDVTILYDKEEADSFVTLNNNHIKLLKLANDNLEKSNYKAAFIFFKKLYQEYVAEYNPFDSAIYIILDNMVILSYLNNENEMGYKISKILLKFISYMSTTNIINNCEMLYFKYLVYKFIFVCRSGRESKKSKIEKRVMDKCLDMFGNEEIFSEISKILTI